MLQNQREKIMMSKMLMRLLIGILLVFSSVALAQDEAGKTISGGVVNGKARNLVRPQYPPAARAVNASGQVQVQVTIDENGSIISATAISGHPLLRAASVEAARQSQFMPTLLEGKPVKVTGVIVYNFTVNLNIFQIGFELASAEAAQRFDETFHPNSIVSSLPEEWTNERKQAQLIASKQLWEQRPKFADSPPKIESPTTKTVNEPRFQAKEQKRQGVTTIIGDISPENPMPRNVEVKESFPILIRSLADSIKARLANDAGKSWTFSLSLAFGKTFAQIENDQNLKQNLADLKVLAASAPANIKQEFLASLKQISELGDDGEISPEERAQIRSFVIKLK